MKRSGLDGGDSFGDKLLPAIHESGAFRAVFEGLLWNRIIIRFIRLSEIRRVSVWNRAVCPHPVESGAGVETTGERYANLVADRKTLKYGRHLMMMVGVRLGCGMSPDVVGRQRSQHCFCGFEHRSNNDAHDKYDQTD